MKKKNTYLADDEIDLGNIIKLLWKKKILILSVSIICGLLGYYNASLKPQEFKSEITLKNPPRQIFETYKLLNSNILEEFNSNFNLNFLSLDNLQSCIEESIEFDNFKEYLKSRNISAKQYFIGKSFGGVKEKNIIIPNKYFIVHSKELDGTIFLNKCVEFIKKETIREIKKNLKLTIENRINHYEEALEIAKLINLENLSIRSLENLSIRSEESLFYKGSKALTQDVINLKKLFQKLENDQFNFDLILDKASSTVSKNVNVSSFFVSGLFLGFLLSLAIIFLKEILKKKL